AQIALRKPEERRKSTPGRFEAPPLALLRRLIIHFEHSLISQKLRETIRASIEPGARNNHLRRPALNCTEQAIIDKPGADEHEIGHSRDFRIPAGLRVILFQRLGDGVFRDELQLRRTEKPL